MKTPLGDFTLPPDASAGDYAMVFECGCGARGAHWEPGYRDLGVAFASVKTHVEDGRICDHPGEPAPGIMRPIGLVRRGRMA